MPRLLRPAEYAVLTQLFGILLVEFLGTQVIQVATAKLAAQYRARDDDDALHVFVRRWLRRLALGAAVPGVAFVGLAEPIAGALAVTPTAVVLLGAALFLSILLTFLLGLLQGLGRFVWLGTNLVLQAGTRLLLGAAIVLAGFGVDGAFSAAALGFLGGALLALVPLRHLLGAARHAVAEPHLGVGEGRFFALAAIVLLAYAGLTNADAVLGRALLSEADEGAYAGAITLGKVILFAPLAIGFIVLERTARAHERREDTDRLLGLALAFVALTSGAVALGYFVAPAFFTALVVGSQYPMTPALVPTYGVAALSNALLGVWNAYFLGRGRTGIGVLLAAALVAEVVLLVTVARDPLTMVRIVAGVALVTQAVAVGTFLFGRRR
jgi:O-antigen/teichoic acid export membrane protein